MEEKEASDISRAFSLPKSQPGFGFPDQCAQSFKDVVDLRVLGTAGRCGYFGEIVPAVPV